MSVSAKELNVFRCASLRSCALAHAFIRRTRSGNLVSTAAICFRAMLLKVAALFPTVISHLMPATQILVISSPRMLGVSAMHVTPDLFTDVYVLPCCIPQAFLRLTVRLQ
jgi:hypothetical protein